MFVPFLELEASVITALSLGRWASTPQSESLYHYSFNPGEWGTSLRKVYFINTQQQMKLMTFLGQFILLLSLDQRSQKIIHNLMIMLA